MPKTAVTTQPRVDDQNEISAVADGNSTAPEGPPNEEHSPMRKYAWFHLLLHGYMALGFVSAASNVYTLRNAHVLAKKVLVTAFVVLASPTVNSATLWFSLAGAIQLIDLTSEECYGPSWQVRHPPEENWHAERPGSHDQDCYDSFSLDTTASHITSDMDDSQQPNLLPPNANTPTVPVQVPPSQGNIDEAVPRNHVLPTNGRGEGMVHVIAFTNVQLMQYVLKPILPRIQSLLMILHSNIPGYTTDALPNKIQAEPLEATGQACADGPGRNIQQLPSSDDEDTLPALATNVGTCLSEVVGLRQDFERLCTIVHELRTDETITRELACGAFNNGSILFNMQVRNTAGPDRRYRRVLFRSMADNALFAGFDPTLPPFELPPIDSLQDIADMSAEEVREYFVRYYPGYSNPAAPGDLPETTIQRQQIAAAIGVSVKGHPTLGQPAP
ncbi:hypothetical protein DL93DRAFT_2098099 [Clavulina sp. PMI_390]|nr:hypothetical protein DL93DRAFT_2098099 [Clavulina sp. PMI_390]